MKFGLFMISEFVEVVVLSGVLCAIFFGGWHLGIGDQWLTHKLAGQQWLLGSIYATVFWVKVILLCYLQLVIRWTFPRFRYDQIQSLGWKILLPTGLVNLFVTGALILWDPSLRMLAIVGAIEIFIVFALTLTSPAGSKKDEHGPGHDAHGAPAAAHH
jgi:NADH-quinone oxidoreductase subunit H